MEDLRYPIGKYIEQPFSEKQLKEWLFDIKMLPVQAEAAVHQLDEAQLHTAYRPGGWTVHQLIHHLADSHMNAYIRFKRALTEDNPQINPYDQDAWALLSDSKNLPINISNTLLHALHLRWHQILVHLKSADWDRTVYHPEHQKTITLWNLLGMYAWHGKHHLAHIRGLRERAGWD